MSELLPSSKGAFNLFADDDDEVAITRRTIASELMYVMRCRQVWKGRALRNREVARETATHVHAHVGTER